MFLVLRSSSSKPNPHKKTMQPKQKAAKTTRPKQKAAKTTTSNRSKVSFKKTSKRSFPKTVVEERDQQEQSQVIKKLRPEDEVVTYTGIDFQFREIIPAGKQVLVGPPSLTRFEKARITGARSLQLSLGAPPLMKIPEEIKDSVALASLELNAKALPISIRRVLPNGMYQDIPANWLK